VRRLDGDFGDDGRETSIWKKKEGTNIISHLHMYVCEREIDGRETSIRCVCVRARTRASALDDQVCVHVCVCSAAVLHDGDDNSGAKVTTASTRVLSVSYFWVRN
jgi:hypothetical protein